MSLNHERYSWQRQPKNDAFASVQSEVLDDLLTRASTFRRNAESSELELKATYEYLKSVRLELANRDEEVAALTKQVSALMDENAALRTHVKIRETA